MRKLRLSTETAKDLACIVATSAVIRIGIFIDKYLKYEPYRDYQEIKLPSIIKILYRSLKNQDFPSSNYQ